MNSSGAEASIPTCDAPNADPGKPKIATPPNACDCHAHIVGPLEKYPLVPRRTYSPAPADVPAYQRMLTALGVERAVIVQPSFYGVDNRCTYDAVVQSRGKWHGVAVVDADVTDQELRRLHEAGFRGVRINLLFKGGPGIGVLKKLPERLAPLGWHVQLLVDGREMAEFAPQLRKLPVPFVIDHMGHMPAELGIKHPGFQTLLALVREGNCWVKLSGAYRISSRPFPYDDVTPLAQALVEAGAEHMVWGSDWPHPAIQAEMPVDAGLLDLLATWVPDQKTRNRILVQNPARLYGFSAD